MVSVGLPRGEIGFRWKGTNNGYSEDFHVAVAIRRLSVTAQNGNAGCRLRLSVAIGGRHCLHTVRVRVADDFQFGGFVNRGEQLMDP